MRGIAGCAGARASARTRELPLRVQSWVCDLRPTQLFAGRTRTYPAIPRILRASPRVALGGVLPHPGTPIRASATPYA